MLERILENFSKYLFYVGLDEVTSVTFSFTGTVGNTLLMNSGNENFMLNIFFVLILTLFVLNKCWICVN